MKFNSILLLCCCVCHSLAYGDEFYLSPDIGRGKLEMKPQYTVDNESIDLEFSTTGFSVGYLFDVNILTEANISLSASDNVLSIVDDYEYYEVRLLVGYSLALFKHFRIVPKIGASIWELDTAEGVFLNPGDEQQYEFSGADYFGQINFEFPVNDLLLIYGAYMKSEYDFGDAESRMVGMKFSFDL